MLIDPEIAAKHWEEAAVDQKARDLRAEGYEVLTDKKIGKRTRVDLWAQKPNAPPIVYEFRTWGWSDEEKAGRFANLRKAVEELGGEFRLVIVTPPRQKTIELADVEAVLAKAVPEHCAAELSRLSDRTEVAGIHSPDITSISVRDGVMSVRGQATVELSLAWDRDEEATHREQLPMQFDLTMDVNGRVTAVNALVIDTTSLDGEPDDDPALESMT
jgi:hypothetical protein